MKEYEIARRTGMCSLTARPFEEGESFYAVLFERPEGFERCEYSLDSWQGPPEGYFSFWKSRVPQKQQKKQLFVDNEVIMDMFLRLEDTDHEIKKHFRFVLALILMRKRALKYEQTVLEDGCEYWLMRKTGEEVTYQVLNPRLSDEQIEAVSKELGAILHGDTSAFVDSEHATTPDASEAETQEQPDDPPGSSDQEMT